VSGRLRQAHRDDAARLLSLWQVLFDVLPGSPSTDWQQPAVEWFLAFVDDPAGAARPSGPRLRDELIQDVISWARTIAADRIDLSATEQGQRIYQRLGFTLTSAPRMKLVL
jgi:hypothetical protein